jgi:hypothetical protein
MAERKKAGLKPSPEGTPLQAVAQTRPEEYALTLQDPPLVRQIAARARIQSAQQQLRGELIARSKIAVSGSVETLLNAEFVHVPRERVAELRSLPGVRRVVRLLASSGI